MSDPQRPPAAHPRRAAPLQPDKPGSGRQASDDDNARAAAASDSLRQAKEQEDTAVDNAREGHG